MNLISIINLILIAGVIQGFVFNIFTIHISKKKPGWAVIYLNLSVLVLSLNNLQAWLIEIGFRTNSFFLEEMLVPWYMFILPTFHAFLIYFLRIQNKVKSYIPVAIKIFLVELIIRIVCIAYVYYLVPGLDNSSIQDYTQVEEIFNALFNLFIFYKCYEIIFRKQELYTFINKYDDISWLRIFLRLGGFVFLLWIIAIIGYQITGNRLLNYPLRLGISVLIYWIGYQGFFRYHKVKDRISIRRSLSSNSGLKLELRTNNNQISSSNQEEENYLAELKKIDHYLVDKQAYLDPNLSLESLADALNMSPSHLSRIVNSTTDYNFPDYINSLRIQQAKKLLQDNEFCRYTIVSIGLECGFNSKSTFYTAFKKFTSKTPSQFRESTC
ncbi:AraC family transcriptional regulator [Gramella sp. BOM4]|nr:AraC family transcriptional regulator [Christiangramia bathymodioli]